MIKNTIIAICLSLFVFSKSFTQVYTKTEVKPIETISLEKSVTVLPIWFPAIAHEIRVKRLTSIYVSLKPFLTGQLMAKDGNVAIVAMPSVDLRHYYNLDKRAKENLNISRNSGNYLAMRVEYIFPRADVIGVSSDEKVSTIIFGFVWGIQRNYAKGFHLGLSIGPGMMFNSEKVRLINSGEFKIGIQLGSKKD